MSRLFVLTRPHLAVGFHLAGVDAYAIEDVESAQDQINIWLESDETNLLAIDDGLLEQMEPAFIKRLEASENLPYLAIPSGQSLGAQASRRHRLTQMIRRAIGFHITFKGEQTE